MMLFYAPDLLADGELPETESQHCVRVLRKQAGDEIELTDGKGCFYRAQITEAHPKHCKLRILETIPAAPLWKNRIEIAIAPTKNIERIEWFAEKAAEMGIDKIIFLKTRYSERKELKTDRIHKLLAAAIKQSGQARLPEVQEMTDFTALVRQDFEGQKWIAHCGPGENPLLSRVYRPDESVLTLIGPEGGFSEEEIQVAAGYGFQSVSLGKSRLRTETAALAVCQTIHTLQQLA